MSQLTVRRIVLGVAVGCFIVSLFLPAFSSTDSEFDVTHVVFTQGWTALAFGWIALIFIQTPAIAWLANPFFLFALRDFWRRQYQSSMWLAVACLLFGSSFFLLSLFQPLLVVFSGNGQTLYHPKQEVGFAIWMISFFVIFLASAVLSRPETRG
ncbi:MAG TPA: hypothetical protein VL997_12710 [Dyella sp.]|nr:hypothetical protein [Dyella sp.]